MKTCIVLLCFLALKHVNGQLRIAGGLDADIEDWPFMVFMVFSNGSNFGPACGASLLSSQTILTAAHCLDDVTHKKKKFKDFFAIAYMGHVDIFKATLKRQVIDYVTHPDYKRSVLGNDIGIGFLVKPVDFSTTIKKVILKTTALNMEEDGMLMAAGWGAWKNPVDAKSPISPRLKYIDQEWVPNSQCFNGVKVRREGLMCAGTKGANKYVFTGDSGGPLVTSDYHQVGIVTYKFHNDNGPTVYTYIPDYIDWLVNASEHLFKHNCKEKRKQL